MSDRLETIRLAFVGTDGVRRMKHVRSEDVEWLIEEVCRLRSNERLLAKLAATTPQFNSPIEAWAAERLRDELLTNSAAT